MFLKSVLRKSNRSNPRMRETQERVVTVTLLIKLSKVKVLVVSLKNVTN